MLNYFREITDFEGSEGTGVPGSPFELLHSPRHHLRQAGEGVRGLQFPFFCTDLLPAGDTIAFTSFHSINSQDSYFCRCHARIEKSTSTQSIFGEHAQSMRFMKMKKKARIGQRFRCKRSSFRPGHSGYQITAASAGLVKVREVNERSVLASRQQTCSAPGMSTSGTCVSNTCGGRGARWPQSLLNTAIVCFAFFEGKKKLSSGRYFLLENTP